MPVCFATVTGVPALAGLLLAGDAFTLAWTHSIERIRWEERWRVEAAPGGAVLVLGEGRVRGSGPGMTVPENAVREADGWRFTLDRRVPALTLANSDFAADYIVCAADGCRPLATRLPAAAAGRPVTLTPCP